MVVYKGFMSKSKAKKFASKKRKKGYIATVYPIYAIPGNKREGVDDWRVSVTRKK